MYKDKITYQYVKQKGDLDKAVLKNGRCCIIITIIIAIIFFQI